MAYNPYQFNNYNLNELQAMRERIDRTMNQIQQPIQQAPAPITQNFQLAPNTTNSNDFDGKYAGNIEEVKNTLVFKDTIFTNKEMSLLWLKDATGNVKTFTIEEVIEKDEKDIEIDNLKDEIKQLKEMILNGKSDARNDDENTTTKRSPKISANKSNDE